jgi:putative nucleotidyltransferase with HDIG domain
VYIRLGAGKYVKLIRSGDVPPVDQIKRYVSKGIGFFFIRKDIQETYVRYCEQVANALISNANISLDTKVNQTMNQGVETLSLIQTHGVNDPTMGYASRFVLNVSKVVREYDLVSNDEIARFLGNVSSYEHNTSVAAMSGMLALALKLDSEKSAHIIGMAGLLHDVGMMKLGLLEGAGEREDEMTPEERAIYETHPLVGAEELAKLKRFDPAVIQSVAQHHFRRDGSGFPSRSHFTHIHICAEIVGICDEYDYRVRRKRRMPHLNVASEMEKVYPLFSKQVVQAFLNTFMKDEAPLLSDGQILI